MQPGDTIQPGGKPPEETPPPAEPNEQPAAPAPEPPQEPEPPASPESQWEFHDEGPEAGQSAPVAHNPVTWTASEYVAHEKGLGWYVLLGLTVVAFAAVVYLITGEIISSVVIVIMGIAFGAFAARQPRELTYVLDNTGLTIGDKPYPFGQFKSFTVVEEGPIHSIMLMPLKRFMPPLSIYFAPEDEDKIANALSSYLPYEDRRQDAVDRLMRKVRF